MALHRVLSTSGTMLLQRVAAMEGCRAATCAAAQASRSYATQPVTATLFPGDGEPVAWQYFWVDQPRRRPAPGSRPTPYVTRPHETLMPCRPAGIGPEIAVAVQKIFTEAKVPVAWDEQHVGKEVDPRTNSYITRENLDSVLVRRC